MRKRLVKWGGNSAGCKLLNINSEGDVRPDPFFPLIVGNIRRIQINIFPYSIFYKIDGNILIILRIFHNQRKPIEWQNE